MEFAVEDFGLAGFHEFVERDAQLFFGFENAPTLTQSVLVKDQLSWREGSWSFEAC